MDSFETIGQLEASGLLLYSCGLRASDLPLPAKRKPARRLAYRTGWTDRGNLVREPSGDADPRYLDLRYDYAYKRTFGSEANKDLLIHFLNSLFQGRMVIRDVRFLPTERLGEHRWSRKVIYDILCINDEGEYFLVEMQRAYQPFFSNRLLYYGCRMVDGQVPVGAKGDDYAIKKVYVIALLDYILWDKPTLHRYRRSAGANWKDTGEKFGEIEWIIIQLPAFDKKLAELDTDLERWIYLLKYLPKLKERPASFEDPAFRKVFTVNKLDNFTPEERNMLKLEFNRELEWQNAISYAQTKSREEGRQEGEAVGERKKELSVLQNLIAGTEFNDREIASLVGVEERLVRKIRTGQWPKKE